MRDGDSGRSDIRVTVVGAGAIGGTVGVLLHQIGHRVVLVDRDAAHVTIITRDGFRLSGLRDVAERVPAIVPEGLADLVRDGGLVGMVVLAVKAMDTESAVEQIRPHLAPDGYIVS